MPSCRYAKSPIASTHFLCGCILALSDSNGRVVPGNSDTVEKYKKEAKMAITFIDLISFIKDLLTDPEKLSKFREIISDIKELVNDIKDLKG